MQALSEIDNRQRVALNSSFSVKNKNSSIKSNNSRVSVSQSIGNFGPSKTDYNINFDFKYVTQAELQTIVKRVKRARQKKQDEEKWQWFVRAKQHEAIEDSSDDGVCERCAVGKVNCGTECDLSQPQDHCKTMLKEEDDVQENFITSVALGTSIADNIGHAYQLGGVLTKRLQDLVATVGRMTSLLLSSANMRCTQYEDDDVDRAIKRSVEFDAMFARNHLYELQRLLKDTKQLATGKCPQSELETKISAALKCVMQALQVYAKHVSKGSRAKYQQVVPIFQSISTIHSLLEQLTGQRAFPFRQELEVSCSYMKQLLLEMSATDTQSVRTVSRKPAKPKPAARHKPSADLSMYSRRCADWRRKTASLARAKFGPPSGKKHGQVKASKEPVNAKEVPYRNATRAVPEDDVTTMMEMIPSEKSPTRSKPTTARSVKEEPTNVQLICLREEESPKSNPIDTDTQANNNCKTKEDSITTLTIEEQTKTEAVEYHQKMVEYHKANSHYKDGKALGIVDRLATRILTEMVMDFQKEEMNNVIEMLYNLEFQ